MHLPWKKHRISQFVADLHSPSNRGGSLVVLVDLFFKNRDRLRKTSLKKRCNRRESDSSDVSKSAVTAVPVATRPPISTIEPPEVSGGKFGNESSAISVSAVVFKAFVAVAMALNTTKLVVGISLSAFVLLLLECVGKHMDLDLSVFLKHAKERLFGSIQSEIDVCDKDSVVEIERVGADLAAKVSEEEDLLIRNNNSRICRVKSILIRRFIPKKFRSLKKGEGRDLFLSTDMHIDSGEHELECASNEYDDEESETPCEAREGNSGCPVMLVLIILVGLFGGRIWALVLTLVWCLVSRFCWQRKACVKMCRW